MATKTKKTSAKKPVAKMSDLPARKNPKGGAQKKEVGGSPDTSRVTRGGSPNRVSRQVN